jgi:hypothetical protein
VGLFTGQRKKQSQTLKTLGFHRNVTIIIPFVLVPSCVLLLGNFKTESRRDGLVYVEPADCQGCGGRPLDLVCRHAMEVAKTVPFRRAFAFAENRQADLFDEINCFLILGDCVHTKLKAAQLLGDVTIKSLVLAEGGLIRPRLREQRFDEIIGFLLDGHQALVCHFIIVGNQPGSRAPGQQDCAKYGDPMLENLIPG